MLQFIKKMWWFIGKHPFYYITILLLGIVQALLLLYPAEIIANFSKALQDQTFTIDFLLKEIVVKSLGIAVLIYVVTTTRRVVQNRLKVKLFYALQTRYMRNILAQDAIFFEMFQSGDLLTRALGDVKSVNFSGGNRLLNIFYEVTLIVFYLIAMVQIHPLLTLYSVLPLSLIFVVNIILKVRVKKNWKNVREASSDMGNVILESITNVRTIRAYSLEEENYKKNMQYSKKVYDVEKKNLAINVLFQPIFQSIVAISIIIAYLYANKILFDNEAFKIDQFIKFTIYLNLLASPLTNIGNMLTNFYQSIISIDRLNEIYDAKSNVVDKEDAKVLNNVDKIEFKDISFKYPNDEDYIIKNINLTIKKGQTIGIVGKTGSGKSTLIRQLLRQFPITEGKLLINGIDVADYTKESVREMIGYVPQEHTLFTRTVLENVEFGNHEINEDLAYQMIKAADFEKDVENLPDGLKTVVGEYGVTLSGGQKQRLSIARAFMKEADVLILDDSLSAVDGKTESNIIHNLDSVRNGKTNIIVAHRLSAVMNADYIIVLDNGRIIEEGTHESLMNNNGWYKELFLHQQMVKEGD